MNRVRIGAAPAGVAGDGTGASLVELLVSLVFVSLLAAISGGFARAAFMSARVQEAKSTAQEATVMALDVMARELRMAGYSAAGAAVAGVRVAADDQIEVAADLNGDGDTTDSNEVIAYRYDATKQQLMRATGGGSPQPVVLNVPLGGMRFSYFDAAGNLMPAAAGLASSDRARVRRVAVSLRVVSYRIRIRWSGSHSRRRRI